MSWMASVIGVLAVIFSLAIPGSMGIGMTMFGMGCSALGAVGMGIELAIKESRK